MSDVVSKAFVPLLVFGLLSNMKQKLGRVQFFALFLAMSYFGRKFKSYLQLFTKKFGESTYDRVGAILLKTEPVRKEYAKLLNDTLTSTRPSIQTAWKEYGEVYTAIPEEGLTVESLKSVVNNLSYVAHKKLEDTHHSGSIYSFSYWKDSTPQLVNQEKDFVNHELKQAEDFDKLAHSLSELYTTGFRESYLWNSLHEGEFGMGYWLQYQVVRMVADLYGGKHDEVMGLVTSGGTESLMTAMRMYREWGIVNRNHSIGQGVVLCAENVHAAVNKAGITYDINIQLIPVRADGKMDLEALQAEVDQIGTDLIAIVGSTPSYSLGVVDDIPGIAAIAKAAGVGMHVDSCLGGFIVNFVDTVSSDFLAIDGVTSLSCDTHKNGWAPKGSSVLVTKALPDAMHPPKVNLCFYGAFSIPEWDGGIYGTPSFPGSAAVAHILHAYLAMLHIGKSGYRQIARSIQASVTQMAQVISADSRLELLGDHPANVVAWRINPSMKWGQGAIYAMVHEMSKQNFVLSALAHDRVHYCVTGRSAACPKFAADFAKCLKAAVDKTEEYAMAVKAGKMSFPGDAGLYGTIEAAMSPSANNTKSKAEYYSNLLLGKRVARDSVKAHFYALQDPYINQTL